MSDLKFIGIYVGVGLAVAFLYGLLDDSPRKTGNPRLEAGFIAGLWPLWLFIGIVSSPLWLPALFAEIGAAVREHGEKKRTVKRMLETVVAQHRGAPKVPCPNCGYDVTGYPTGQNCRGCGIGL